MNSEFRIKHANEIKDFLTAEIHERKKAGKCIGKYENVLDSYTSLSLKWQIQLTLLNSAWLLTWKSKIGVTSYKLWDQIHELRVQIHELLVQTYELPVKIHELEA